MRLTALLLVLLPMAASVSADPPTVRHWFPLGGQRGTTFEIKATGKFPDWPATVVTDSADLTFEPGKESGTFQLSIAETAEPGPRHLRIVGKGGVSELRAFVVSTVKEMAEAEPNDELGKATVAPELPVIINGALQKGGDVDVYAIELKEGQTLVADIDSEIPFHSPLDATLQLVSEQGFVLAEVDDAPGLDPRIAYTVSSPGKYYVRVFGFPADPNQSIGFTGSAEMIYRLTLTANGYVQATFPLALQRQEAASQVRLLGPGLPDDASLSLQTLPPATSPIAWLDGRCGTYSVPLVEHPVQVEGDANGKTIAAPVTLCGTISEPGEKDEYRIHASKDEILLFRVTSRALGFPLDARVQLVDEKGKILATVDDVGANRDAELRWVSPADGDYTFTIRDLHGMGGVDFHYRCDILRPAADFALTLASDRFDATVGTELEIPVTVARLEGFAEPIKISCTGLKEGVTATAAVSEPKGDTAAKVTLKLTGAAPMEPQTFQVVGQVGDGPPHIASVTVDTLKTTTDRAWLTVSTAKEKK